MDKRCFKCAKLLPPRRRKFCSMKCLNRYYDMLRSGSVERYLARRKYNATHKEKNREQHLRYYREHKEEVDRKHREYDLKRKMLALTFGDLY